MSRAVAFIRKSQGEEDDVSLQLQRDRVNALAEKRAEKVECVDLGVHTGFSIHTRPETDKRIDANGDVLTLLEDLRAGKYDYLCTWDDTRLARDQFFWEMKRAAIIGGCELVFVEDTPEDELTFRVQRAVESDVKRREIEKSREALEARAEQGHDQGRPPYGLTYDNAGEHWVPDHESAEFREALDVIRLRKDDVSWRDIEDETNVSRTTARRIWERRERYLEAGKNSM